MIDLSLICCPFQDHGDLVRFSVDEVACIDCGRRFKTIEGRPILLDESKSIFSVDEIAFGADKRQFPIVSGWRYRFRKALPAAASRDIGLKLLEKHKFSLPTNAAILVLGCGFTGGQYKKLFPMGDVVLTDATLQGDADVACDAECLPFRDQTFDCVVVDQVLEHTLNPLTVVDEIHRCLKLDGIVYSGIPFLTPVHGFPFDFQRYTPLGHRMLFRRFQELEIYISQGPVSAISKTMIESLACISDSLFWKRISSAGIRLIVAPLLWLDNRHTFERELTVPAATTFLGKKLAVEESPSSVISQWAKSRQR